MKLISLSVIALVVMFATAFGPSRESTATSSAPAVPAACDAAPAEELAIGAVTCGGVVCGKNQHCCNASCGKCAPIGVECPQIACEGGEGAQDSDQAF